MTETNPEWSTCDLPALHEYCAPGSCYPYSSWRASIEDCVHLWLREKIYLGVALIIIIFIYCECSMHLMLPSSCVCLYNSINDVPEMGFV